MKRMLELAPRRGTSVCARASQTPGCGSGLGRAGPGRMRAPRPSFAALHHEPVQQQLQRPGLTAGHRRAEPAEQLLLAGEDGAAGDARGGGLQVSTSGSSAEPGPLSVRTQHRKADAGSGRSREPVGRHLGVFLHLGFALFPEPLSAGRGGRFSPSRLSVRMAGIKWLRFLKPRSLHQFCFLKRNAIILRNSGQVAGLYFVATEK